MYEKWASKREGGMDYYHRQVDRVTKLVDADGDGTPDMATNLAKSTRSGSSRTALVTRWSMRSASSR